MTVAVTTAPVTTPAAVCYERWGLRCCTLAEFAECWEEGLERSEFCGVECDREHKAAMRKAGRCSWSGEQQARASTHVASRADAARGKQLDGDRLRQLREARGLGQRQLAKATGLARATVADIEHGKRAAHDETIGILARALGVAERELIGA